MGINNNFISLYSNSMRISSDYTQAMERLSSGYRINYAKDDAAGLAISHKLNAQISGLTQANRNVSQGISAVQTAEEAMTTQLVSLNRMKELAVQASSGTYTDADRDAMDLEFQALITEIDRVADNTSFNNQVVLNGTVTSMAVQVGTGTTADNTITISFADTTKETLSISEVDLKDIINAGTANTAVDEAIVTISNAIATAGAQHSVLSSASDANTAMLGGTTSARNNIMNADLAVEVARLEQSKVLQQISYTMLAQNNANLGLMLKLFE
jgi:flagellin